MQDARTQVIPLFDLLPQQELPSKEITIPNDAGLDMKLEGGALKIPTEDGGVVIDFNPAATQRAKEAEFYDNLADDIDAGELTRISTELLDAIDSDEQSRSDWLETRARGITLLGLKLEEPRSDTGGSAPLEGMSQVRHPLLLEAVLRFQANARGELLPSSGPVKVRNDRPPPPEQPNPAIPAEQQEKLQKIEDLATALEMDMNHYLTVVAKEYVPDTDRMLFQVGFGGAGIKKVYNCPIRRRPVSETIDPKDFIVNNSATDLSNAGRITHRIMMRPSTLKRMQIVGAYRDVLIQPTSLPPKQNEVDEKIAEVQGISQQPTRWQPEDIDQELFECYCELDIPGYEHKDEDGHTTGLRVPYKVTIHKESRQVLEIRRNFDEDDTLCLPREYFSFFEFVPGLGFWPIGLLNILGNATVALTAAWREMLDAAMFANFPGFLFNKAAGRQLTNQFRIAPGSGLGLDVGMGSIHDAVMPLPYKEPGAAMINFITGVQELSQRLGGTAEITVGEGKQEAPVGTTLALIEQAAKAMDAVHKRMHQAQAKEFQLLKERFREDPEAFWRHNKRPRVKWATDMFMEALEQHELVPVADPNNPTSLHRVAKAAALQALAQQYPQLFDAMAVAKRILRITNIDAEGLFNATPTPPPPDPKLLAVAAKAAGQSQQVQGQITQAQIKAQSEMAKLQGNAEDRKSKENIALMQANKDQAAGQNDIMIESQKAAMEQQRERRKLEWEGERNRLKAEADRVKHEQKMKQEQQKNAMQMQSEQQRMAIDAHMQEKRQAMDLQGQQRQMQIQERQQNRQAQLDEHSQHTKMQADERMLGHKERMAERSMNTKLEAQKMGHEQKIEQGAETHKAKLQQTKQMVKAKPKKDKS